MLNISHFCIYELVPEISSVRAFLPPSYPGLLHSSPILSSVTLFFPGLLLQVFESVEEVDQIEMEPKGDETKQVPKIPNGALPNGTSSPDSGHPSSRNFSITSGLSDRSLSTEDSSAPEPAAKGTSLQPQLTQPSLVKTEQQAEPIPAASIDTKLQVLPEKGSAAKEGAKGIEREEAVAVDKEVVSVAEMAECKTQQTGGDVSLETKEAAIPATQAANDPETVKAETPETKWVSKCPEALGAEGGELKEPDEREAAAQGLAATDGHHHAKEEAKGKEMKEGKPTESKEIKVQEIKENGMKFMDINMPKVFETGSKLLTATEIPSSIRTEEVLLTTDSDESPSAIEMEEIPLVAKVSMSPWDRKAPSESTGDSLSALADSVGASPELEDAELGPAGLPVLELRLEDEVGKASPEGSGSALSEPEMESLFPQFDSLAVGGEVKNEAASPVSSIGTTYSVRRCCRLEHVRLAHWALSIS